MEKVNVGIIGTGNVAEMHAQAYVNNPNANLIAVCGRHGDNAKRFAERFGVPKAFTSLEEILAVPELKAVSVATANSDHGPSTIAALNAGKHVIVEKPMALSCDEARLMHEAAERSGKLLMVGMKYRFTKDFQLLRDMVANGEFGELYYAEMWAHRRHGHPGGTFAIKADAGGGILFDCGSHFLDDYYFVAGKPKAVSVYCANYNKLGMRPGIRDARFYISRASDGTEPNEVEDLSLSVIRYDNGSVMNMPLSFALNVEAKNGEEAGYRFCGTKMGAAHDDESLKLFSDLHGYMTNTSFYTSMVHNYLEEFEMEMINFLGAIRGAEECLSPSEDGVEVMRVLEALYKSAETGHEVIIER
ncbi:MAG: Gfo/Idh/MocA family oxidoreductase [Synergistaceae bacterium]|nr:Gfo/Idh/MocA family oxidoreductase [Synergistaceae bacterium]